MSGAAQAWSEGHVADTVPTMLESMLTMAIDGAAQAHRRLEEALAGLDDGAARGPSLLAGWTIGHVLAHLARNAESHVRVLEGARLGERVAQYPGGPAQRAGDIDAGATQSAAVLVADLLAADAALESCWHSFDAWPADLGVDDIVLRRWREVEVHHADLGPSFGRTYRDWSPAYLRLELRALSMLWDSRRPMGLTGLPAAVMAVDEPDRLAWMLGRRGIDGVDAAGLMP